ncbi:MAG: hypothetical protein RIQ81_1070 [Pseudomonadota bacterium]
MSYAFREKLLACVLSLNFCGLVYADLPSPTLAPHPMAGASATGAPGESGLLFLVNDSWYVNPLNNDIAGRTDKFLTHSTRLGWTRSWKDESIDVRMGWRFITPSHRIADGIELRPPVGAYGDWAEIQIAYAILFADSDELPGGIRPRVQIEAGLGHLGPKGAREVQVNLHKKLDNSWEHLTWVDQKRGVTSSAGMELGLASGLWVSGDWTTALYGGWAVSSSPVIFESMTKATWVAHHARNLGLAIEARHFRQFNSLVLPDLRPQRSEFSVGLLLSRWYKPTFTWVGPYYNSDDDAQVFIDFINLNWPF